MSNEWTKELEKEALLYLESLDDYEAHALKLQQEQKECIAPFVEKYAAITKEVQDSLTAIAPEVKRLYKQCVKNSEERKKQQAILEEATAKYTGKCNYITQRKQSRDKALAELDRIDREYGYAGPPSTFFTKNSPLTLMKYVFSGTFAKEREKFNTGYELKVRFREWANKDLQKANEAIAKHEKLLEPLLAAITTEQEKLNILNENNPIEDYKALLDRCDQYINQYTTKRNELISEYTDISPYSHDNPLRQDCYNKLKKIGTAPELFENEECSLEKGQSYAENDYPHLYQVFSMLPIKYAYFPNSTSDYFPKEEYSMPFIEALNEYSNSLKCQPMDIVKYDTVDLPLFYTDEEVMSDHYIVDQNDPKFGNITNSRHISSIESDQFAFIYTLSNGKQTGPIAKLKKIVTHPPLAYHPMWAAAGFTHRSLFKEALGGKEKDEWMIENYIDRKTVKSILGAINDNPDCDIMDIVRYCLCNRFGYNFMEADDMLRKVTLYFRETPEEKLISEQRYYMEKQLEEQRDANYRMEQLERQRIKAEERRHEAAQRDQEAAQRDAYWQCQRCRKRNNCEYSKKGLINCGSFVPDPNSYYA